MLRKPSAGVGGAAIADGTRASTLSTEDPYHDGTTDIVLEPVDFIARLAALVPPPRVHLTRYYGVFAANAALRAAITPVGRGVEGAEPRTGTPDAEASGAELGAALEARVRDRDRAVF